MGPSDMRSGHEVSAERDNPANASLVKIFGSGFDAICDGTWN
jgi:hypothetical protein